jgi:hypothetical protein
MRLVVALVPDSATTGHPAPDVPPSLVRLGRTARFRHTVAAIAAALGRDAEGLSPQLVAALAMLSDAIGTDLTEADWTRLLDALLLIAAYPAT